MQIQNVCGHLTLRLLVNTQKIKYPQNGPRFITWHSFLSLARANARLLGRILFVALSLALG